MNQQALDLVRAEQDTRLRWEEAKHRLQQFRAACQHQWDNPKGVYKPLREEGYYDPGDPPGTRGVDRRLPCHVPATETPQWVRTCTVCGLEEKTTRSREQPVKVPVWG